MVAPGVYQLGLGCTWRDCCREGPALGIDRYFIQSLADVDEARWQENLGKHPGGCYLQSSLYACFEEQARKYTTPWFLSTCGGTILLVLSQFQGEDLLSEHTGGEAVTRLAALMLRRLTWCHGPLCAAGSSLDDIVATLDAVDELARRCRAYMVSNVSPPIHGSEEQWQDYHELFLAHGYESRQHATVHLRLKDCTKDDLWSRLSSEARRKVRKARQQGITVTTVNSQDDVNTYYRVKAESHARSGVPPVPLRVFRATFNSQPRDVYRMMITWHKGNPISAQSFSCVNGIVMLEGVCTSNYAIENSIYGNDFMQWHVIELAYDLGARVIDWVGYTLEPTTRKERGINEYKLKWGGEVVTYPVYSKVYSSWRFRFLGRIRQLLSGRRIAGRKETDVGWS